MELALLWSFCVPVLNILGKVRRFSSMVEAGEAERGGSAKDMLREGAEGRKVAEVHNGEGPKALARVEYGTQPSEKVTQIPERTMNLRSVSSVLIVSRSLPKSKNEFAVMLEGVASGVLRPEGAYPGVGGDVAEGIGVQNINVRSIHGRNDRVTPRAGTDGAEVEFFVFCYG
jgi:hypothetical protein